MVAQPCGPPTTKACCGSHPDSGPPRRGSAVGSGGGYVYVHACTIRPVSSHLQIQTVANRPRCGDDGFSVTVGVELVGTDTHRQKVKTDNRTNLREACFFRWGPGAFPTGLGCRKAAAGPSAFCRCTHSAYGSERQCVRFTTRCVRLMRTVHGLALMIAARQSAGLGCML